jgi:histone-lysine N-methyltransferase SETMAR
MFIVLFGVNGTGFVKILPERQKITSDYFKYEIVHAMSRESLGGWRLAHVAHLSLHFDEAPVHNAEGVSKSLTEYASFHIAHSPYSLDLSPCEIFLFGYVREELKHTSYGTPEELEDLIVRAIEAIPRTLLSDVFQSCQMRLEECIKRSG